MKQINIRELNLPPDGSLIDAAKMAIEHGALAWPVKICGSEYEPVPSYAGPGRSAWGLATRDINRFAEVLQAHPGATVGLRVPTPHGFDRHFALTAGRFVEIPAAVHKIGR